MTLKYEILSETKVVDSHILYRIKSLREFSVLDVKISKGTLGGWIENSKNLSQEGNCWVSTNACVYGDAEVSGNAAVFGKSIVCGNAKVQDNVLICARARVEGDVFVHDYAAIIGNSKVSGNAEISGCAFVAINATVTDNAFLGGFAQASDNTVVEGNAKVYGKVWGNSRVCENAVVMEEGVVEEDSYIDGNTVVKDRKEREFKLDLTQKTGPAKPFSGAVIILGAKIPKDYKENLIAQEDEKYQKMASAWFKEKDPERNMQLRKELLAYWAIRREELGIKDPEDEEEEKKKREEEEKKQREIARQKHRRWVRRQVAKGIPKKHILYCNYPGLEFRKEIDAEIGVSYLNEYDDYWEELYNYIDEELCYQGVEKLLDGHFKEKDVNPQLYFDYSETTMAIQEELPHNEKVKIYLESINEDGKTIKKQKIDMMEFFDRNPDYFQEGGMWGATEEYIAASQNLFLKGSHWCFALRNDDGDVFEDPKEWPSPKEDGAWVDENGDVLQPFIWFEVEEEGFKDPWILNEENLDFWLSESKGAYFVEYSYDGHAGSYGGRVPVLAKAAKSCPIKLEVNDTQDSITKKIQAFFIKQYKKAQTKKK